VLFGGFNSHKANLHGLIVNLVQSANGNHGTVRLTHHAVGTGIVGLVAVRTS
jgi:hypothetical protein